MNSRLLAFVILAAPFLHADSPAPVKVMEPAKIMLKDGWFLEPSSEVSEKGSVLSSPSFQPKNWYKTSVPSTVVAALTADGVFSNPLFGMNLRSLPGTTYPIGHNFSNIQMPPGSPFKDSWWYQTKFTVPADLKGRRIQLHFDGINFRANLWVNGKQIADDDKMAGMWRIFEFDVTDLVQPGAPNALAVEITAPTPDDLALTFVDWNPSPPDKGMGIWRDVYLTASGPATVRYPLVVSKLDMPGLAKAHLTVSAEVRNGTGHTVQGTLKGEIEGITFSQPVEIKGNATEVVTFAPEKFAQLNIDNPRLWWPVNTGPQNLYDLKLELAIGGRVSDQLSTQFGIREITSELLPVEDPIKPNEGIGKSRRVYSINGRRILIKGGGYTPDILLRADPERQEAELRYVRDMNLNAVRLEGKLENDNFLSLADKYGVLVFAGWSCCDHWERWQEWDDEDRVIAAESLRDQIRRIRIHPSLANWMNGSDNPPPPDVETMYVDILKELNWPNPYVSSATARPTTVTGDSGVKMTGPYDYVAPSYWMLDTARGGAHGFNSETSPGPAIPVIESLREMLPQDHLWPVDSWWNYHAGGGPFSDIRVYQEALSERYGESDNLHDFVTKAQADSYDGERAMFEAFERNKYRSTGVIQWMLNNSWPSVIWHLYDYYLRPGGGYFGTKKACEPLHLLYSHDDHSVVAVNSTYEDHKGLHATATVYNLDMTSKFTRSADFDLPADGVVKTLDIPAIEGLSSTYFVNLVLRDQSGKEVSSNFYWLSTRADEHDWDASTWYFTPQKEFADYTALNNLPKTQVNVSATAEANAPDNLVRITVENPSKSLAFMVRLNMQRAARTPEGRAIRRDIIPVLWSENYISLLPGEKRVITASYRNPPLPPGPAVAPPPGAPFIVVDGWNITPATVQAAVAK